MCGPQFEPGSFRDPAARVFRHDGAVFRCLTADALRDWNRLASTQFFKRFTEDGRLVPTARLDDPSALPALSPPWVAVLEHRTISVLSYPYEWCFSMLQDAALLQLDLLLAALDEGMTLKDSTPFNIQWVGSRPTFIDVGSFKVAEPGEPWAGYRQFCQQFLYPLFLQAYKDVPFHAWLRGSLEGIDAKHCSSLMSARDFFRPGVFAHVYLLSKAQARYEGVDRDVKRDLRSAGFSAELVKSNVRRMRRTVERLKWEPTRSTWSDYTQCNTYDQNDRERKMQFIQQVAGSRRWSCVWDVGCNTGEYSRLVTDHADSVVAIDADHLAVERLYRALKAEHHAAILPLLGDVVDPSPSLGWRGLERQGLLGRGRPDLILCLALIHHLAISRNIPLPDLIEWLAGFKADLIIEFVAPDDPMVERLLRNRDDLDFGYTQEHFDACLSRHFRVVRQEALGSGTRTVYHARSRSAE